MSQLMSLSNDKHKSLKVVSGADIYFAKQQHLLNVRVNEVGQAQSNFPVFLTKDPDAGVWCLSAITSFEVGRNLFVNNGQWLASFKPAVMLTFPFFLIESANDEKGYTLGIDENSEVFSTDHGEPIFDDSGNASILLSQTKKALEADIQHDINTYQFGKTLDELSLIKPINIIIQRKNGRKETLQGVCTIDEEKLNALPTEQFEMLRNKGYLMPVHAMLLSIYQLNALIRRNNSNSSFAAISQLKLEVNKGNGNALS